MRYSVILLLGLGNLSVFYYIFTPLTVNISAFILNLFSETIIDSSTILFREVTIEIISACVAGSAYYLLFILLMSTPELKIKTRIYALLFSFSLLLIFNSLRIVLLALINQSMYFELVHIVFWYVISTIFVILIWFLTINLFKIRNIPVYTDIKNLMIAIKHSNKKSTRR